MKFDLICDNSVKELGIIDENGHFDMDKFHDHVESCETCLKLLETFVHFMELAKEERIAQESKG